MFTADLLAIPQRRYASYWIEIFHALDSRDYLVMVAANKNSGQRTRAFGDFIWTGAVANDVPEIYGCVRRRSRSQTSFESFQIAVNVAEEKYAQSLPDSVAFETHAETDYKARTGFLTGHLAQWSGAISTNGGKA